MVSSHGANCTVCPVLHFVEGGCWTTPAPCKPHGPAHTQPPVTYWDPSSAHHRPQLPPSPAKGSWMSFCVAIERWASCSGVTLYITLAPPAAGKGQSRFINAGLTLIMFVEQCCKGAFWQACPSSATSFSPSFAFQNHTLLPIKRKWQSIMVCQDRKKLSKVIVLFTLTFPPHFVECIAYSITALWKLTWIPLWKQLQRWLPGTALVAKSLSLTQCFEGFVPQTEEVSNYSHSINHTGFLNWKSVFSTEIWPHSLIYLWPSNATGKLHLRRKGGVYTGRRRAGGSCSWTEEGQFKAQVISRDSIAQTRKQRLKSWMLEALWNYLVICLSQVLIRNTGKVSTITHSNIYFCQPKKFTLSHRITSNIWNKQDNGRF